MGSMGAAAAAAAAGDRPHAVCVPYPAQGHISPMLKLAKLLHHHRGFHITFVNTEYNHKRLLRSRGPAALRGLPGFRFATIPDGLPSSDADSTQDIPSLCRSTTTTCLPHFRRLLADLNDPSSSSPPVSCIVSDGCMSFTLDAAQDLSIPEVLFWTPSACGVLCYTQYASLVQRGLVPLKDSRDFTNGYLDTVIDWIPGIKSIRLRDIPSFIRTTDPSDLMLDFLIQEASRSSRASAVVINTFDALEHDALRALADIYPSGVYSIGPLQLLVDQISPEEEEELKSIGSNLWKEQPECIGWLTTKEKGSVVYVNFGSITVMTAQQLAEFAWGLARSEKEFLWIIRPDLVSGDAAMLPAEFVEETKERGLLASWCPQEEVLKHPAIGGFLTHSGWNSTMESVAGGVPVICWPFFAEQMTNCYYSCSEGEWGIGMEIDSDVRRGRVEELVRELMGEGEKGREMRRRAVEWKTKAEEAVGEGGSSVRNLEKVMDLLLRHHPHPHNHHHQ